MNIIEGEIDRISLLTKRNLERKLVLQKRKDEKNNVSAENEKLSYFDENFNQQKLAINSLLDKCHEIKKQELPTFLNEISKKILLLQKYVANSNIFLRTYDIKKCQESIQELTTKLKELEEELLPKKKFGFKNKPKPKITPKKLDNQDEVDCQKSSNFNKEFCGFSNKVGETLTLIGDEIFQKDVTVESVKNCRVKIIGSPSTVHLNNLKNCYIFTGPVSTSIFAEKCINCTLVIACQQLRLHASNNVNIHLHVTSRAIMEDCSNIFLAPYNLTYDKINEDFEKSGLDKQCNNWTCIDDFNWLNVDQQSPNWSLLKNEDIIDSWDL